VTESIHPDHRIFVSYIDKSREYYRAQGYDNPYRWAYHQDAPFSTLRKPLAESRVGLITTASLLPADPDTDHFALPKVVYAAPVEPAPERLFTDHRSWDKDATHTDDLDSFAPIHRLQESVAAGRIGSLAPRFYGAPTEYSQRKTNDLDAPELLRLCREDDVDMAMLVPL
jgi:hypothetical protein